MSIKITKEMSRFYKEHRHECTNCRYIFKNDERTHLGYLSNKQLAVLCNKCSYLLEKTIVNYIHFDDEYEEPLKNDILWRYMDLPKFISLISRKELYFASANSFEDIFEGAKGILDKKDKWDSFYLDFFEKSILTAPFQVQNELTIEKVKADSERLLKQLNESGNLQRKYTFISCWHLNEYESEAMWKLYSKDVSNALAIKTTFGNLYEALGQNPYIDIGKVKYIDYKKHFTSVNGAFWYKRKSFEHEKEVRAIIRKHDTKANGIYVPIDINKLILGIYVSPYAQEWFVDVVKSIVRKYRLDVTVSYSQMLAKPFY